MVKKDVKSRAVCKFIYYMYYNKETLKYFKSFAFACLTFTSDSDTQFQSYNQEICLLETFGQNHKIVRMGTF